MDRRARLAYSLPLQGHAISEVEGAGRFGLLFDDPDQSRFEMYSAFTLDSAGHIETYEPPCADWVGDVLRSLIGVAIHEARFSSHGDLALTFADGRSLRIEGFDGDWRYSNRRGVRLSGDSGTVA
jgi:hypothetical protein